NDFEEERVLAVPTAPSSGVVPSFACSNLHHTTHRITPPHRASELCVELGAEQQTFVSSEGINQALLSSKDINQALFRDVSYGGRCL
ncbi:hypothetical protein CFP56_040750, partial [Quercus suber]